MHTNVTRLIAVVAALAMVFTLAACGGLQPAASTTAATTAAATASQAQAATPDETQAEKTTLTLLRWGSADQAENNAAAVYSVNPDLAEKMDLEVIIGGRHDSDVAQKCRLSLAANEYLPDIVQIQYTQLAEFAEEGVLRDLGGIWAGYADKVPEGVLNVAKYKDTFYTFPGDPKFKVWYYRSDIFEEAGIDANQVQTLDDFINAGKIIREKFPDSYIMNSNPETDPDDLFMLLSGNGGRLADDDGNYIVDTDPGFRAAIEAMRKINEADIGYNVLSWEPEWEQGFADGTIVAHLTAGWFKRYLPDFAPDLGGQWAVAQYPEIGGSVGGSDGGSDIYILFNNIEHPDLAVEYLTKLRLDKETSIAVMGATKLGPILNEALSDPRVAAPDSYFGDTLASAESEAIKTLKVFPYGPAASREIDILIPHVARYVNGEIDIESALQSIKTDLINQIGNSKNPK